MTPEDDGDLDALAETIADALEDGAVHVSPEAQPRVPDAAVAQLTEKTHAVPYPVFVVLLDDATNKESGGELVDLVHDRVGADGVYLVTAPHGTVWTTVADDGTGAMEGATTVLSSTLGPGSGYEGVRQASAALDALAEQADDGSDGGGSGDAGGRDADAVTGTGSGQTTGPHSTEEFSVDQLTVAVFGGGLVGAVVVFAAVGLWANRRAKRLARPARHRIPAALLTSAARMQRARIRKALSADTLDLAGRLRDLDTRGLTSEAAEGVRRGIDAYTFAGRLVDAEDATRADLAGALVLLTEAGRELELAEYGTAARPKSAGLCVVDPTHGESSARRRIRGGATVTESTAVAESATLPVCGVCARDFDAGRRPQWLRDGGRPYVERDTVWSRTRFGGAGEDLVELIREELVERAKGSGPSRRQSL